MRYLVVLCAIAGVLPGQLRVVTTVPDLADLARQIGGDLVRVDCLTQGHEDLHLVRIRPSLLVKLRRADVFIQLGLDAEHAWVPSLLRNARNKKVRPGGRGFCNASAGVKPLEVPTGRTRADGPDLHLRGNPHFNLDPNRFRQAARNVHAILTRLAPTSAEDLDARLAMWEKALDGRLAIWKKKLAPHAGAAFIEYHSAWVYFADSFGLRIVAKLEPKPGVAPGPRHLAEVIKKSQEHKVALIIARPQNADVARRVARETGAHVAILQLGSATTGKTAGWFVFMDHVVNTFASHLRRS